MLLLKLLIVHICLYSIDSLHSKPSYYFKRFRSVEAINSFSLDDKSALIVRCAPRIDIDAWDKGFTTTKQETCEVISDSLPKDIIGTYFRNGMAKFEIQKESILHPLDGDGMLCAITINNGTAVFRNRFVRTKGYLKELRSRNILFRGAFGTKPKGLLGSFLNINFKSVANTNVIYWAGRLLALWEQDLPYKMEPESLRTVGKYRFKGALNEKQPFSAHPKVDSNTGRLINFSVNVGITEGEITVFEFEDDMKVFSKRTFRVPGFTFFHDFVVTKNHYIFHQFAGSVDPLAILSGAKSPIESIAFDVSETAKSKLYIVPRDSSIKTIDVVKIDPTFNFHFANAFEDEDQTIVLDILNVDTIKRFKSRLTSSTSYSPVWSKLGLLSEPVMELTRYKLSKMKDSAPSTTSSETLVEGNWKVESTNPLSSTSFELPTINSKMVGRKNRFIYGIASCQPGTPMKGLIKIDLEKDLNSAERETKWFGDANEFYGEAYFVPSGAAPSSGTKSIEEDDDDGYLLSILLNGSTLESYFVVFDAKDITKGPLHKIPLPTNVPHGLHGTYAPNLIFDTDDIMRKFKSAKGIESKLWNEVKGGFSGLGISYDF